MHSKSYNQASLRNVLLNTDNFTEWRDDSNHTDNLSDFRDSSYTLTVLSCSVQT